MNPARGWVSSLALGSLGSPHARPIGLACGEPNDFDMAAFRLKSTDSGQVAIDAAGLCKEGETQLYNYGMLDTAPSTMTAAQKARSTFWLLPQWAAQERQLFKANMQRVPSPLALNQLPCVDLRHSP